jgi:hypothetical protein
VLEAPAQAIKLMMPQLIHTGRFHPIQSYFRVHIGLAIYSCTGAGQEGVPEGLQRSELPLFRAKTKV